MPEEITTLFATAAATFQPIVGQPTDDGLTALRDVLYPLLLDIPFDDQPGGAHNLIGLIQPTATYTARWGAAFPIPNKPALYPAIPDDATPVVRARREAEHAITVRDYDSYEAAERAVAKFIRDNVDELWYRDLRHAQLYYTSVTAKQLMDHLETNCGGLHPIDLVNLPTERWDITLPSTASPSTSTNSRKRNESWPAPTSQCRTINSWQLRLPP